MINVPLWDRAGWRGVLYLTVPGDAKPPLVGLAFNDDEAALSIFREWHNKLGAVDEQERLRVSVLTGVDARNPGAYNVVIGSNVGAGEENSRIREMLIVNRILRVDAKDTSNLDRFRRSFEAVGSYHLACAKLVKPPDDVLIARRYLIQKRSIRIVPAWEIGEHDPDGVGLRIDDDPIIPPEVTDPPVAAVIARKKRHASNPSDPGL